MRPGFVGSRKLYYAWGMLILCFAVIGPGCDFIKSMSENQQQKVQEAYIAYFNAIQAGDITTLRKLVARDKAKELESPDAPAMLTMIKSLYPEQSRVTAVDIKGDAATITLAGRSQGGNVRGTVNLVKEDNLWKVSKENWEMKISMQEEQPVSPPVPDTTKPYDYHRVVGTWKGHEAGQTADDWEFTFGADYAVTVKGPSNQSYRGTAMADWNLGTEGGNIRVLRGGAAFDMRIADAPNPSSIGKISLGSYKLMGDTLQFCGSEPGLMKRTSDFASAGGIRCYELRRISGPPPGSPQSAQPVQQAARPQQPSTPSPFSKQDPGVTGEAIVVKDGKTETYPVRTGFFSDTRMAQPTRATIQFQFPGAEHSNARRIEMTLDATKTGGHYADGKMLSDNFMSKEKIQIGEQTPEGYTASFSWVADGGQIFWPKSSCTITVTSAYTGTPNSVFSGEVRDCPVHSAGIDYTISSVKFVMRGSPSR